MHRLPKITRSGLRKHGGDIVSVYSDRFPDACPVNGLKGSLRVLEGVPYLSGSGNGDIPLESGDRVALEDRNGRERLYRIEL